MPPVRKSMFWAGIGVWFLYFGGGMLAGPRPERALPFYGSLYGAIVFWVVGRQVLVLMRVRRAVRWLRSLGTIQRTRALQDVDDQVARWHLERLVDAHGGPETVGLVERFAFSPVDRREMTVVIWGSSLTAAGVLASITVFSVGDGTRIVATCGVMALVAVALTLRMRASRLLRTYEVSPFGLAEVDVTGAVRRLAWSWGLTLRNRPWRRCVEISVTEGSAYIAIPYTVVGFQHLVELIVAKGGFIREESPRPPGSDRTP